MQDPNTLLMILGEMGRKPTVQFDRLYPKLYNTGLWQQAYEKIASKPGNMTPGVDGQTIDGMNMARIERVIEDLKTARYKPNPVRRVYIPKANGQKRPLGIPSFEDKLLQTVVKMLLEAIYEPTFSPYSHGFRPGRSCHTALMQVKRQVGTRWWIEADIKGFFDNLNHKVLLRILSKRITDQRFLHMIAQFLKAGYIEDWAYQRTYSGVPQGGPLSPLLANIYLNELDQAVAAKIKAFNKGKWRKQRAEYTRLKAKKADAKRAAQQTGDWQEYHRLQQELMNTPAGEPVDPNYRRLYYVRYADDFLMGIIGSKADARELKAWLTDYLRDELKLELSAEKTLITHVSDRVRFLGYDVKAWKGARPKRYSTTRGTVMRRGTSHHLALLMPRDRVEAFLKTYGAVDGWLGKHRTRLIHLSELEILMTYNAEVRGFLNYYALANNLTKVAARVLWMTTNSFLRTIAAKRQTTRRKVVRSLKQGPVTFVIKHRRKDGSEQEYRLFASTRQLQREPMHWNTVDSLPMTQHYRATTELGQRMNANRCEWCGNEQGPFEVHHVRRLKDLHGKAVWEKEMIGRRRKTLVLCRQCHTDLHAGRLSNATKHQEGDWRAGCAERCPSGSVGSSVKPDAAMHSRRTVLTQQIKAIF